MSSQPSVLPRNQRAYVGGELDLFARAERWKRYFGSHLASYLSGDVLEVGAGIGATTRVLCDGRQHSWTCLEPDARLAARIAAPAGDTSPFALEPKVLTGSIDELRSSARFDSILYVDVLEHIEDDAAEVRSAVSRLRPSGTLLVLSPAHPWLYSEFDRAIGHCRRYTRRMFQRMSSPQARIEKILYLDSVGMLLSMANRVILRSGKPSPGQILLWDRVFVRCSTLLDPVLRHRIGKSILGVWRKTG